jgi:hypothetical protein
VQTKTTERDPNRNDIHSSSALSGDSLIQWPMMSMNTTLYDNPEKISSQSDLPHDTA